MGSYSLDATSRSTKGRGSVMIIENDIIYYIASTVISVLCVFGLLAEGIWIGRNFGTFENFLIKAMEEIRRRIG